MYTEAPELEEIAEEIIYLRDNLYHIRENDYSIGYFYKNGDDTGDCKSLGTCQRVTGILEYYTDHDYIICINERVLGTMSDAQLEILLYHELMHIGEDFDIVKHDVEDFYTLLKEFGVDWAVDPDVKGITKGG